METASSKTDSAPSPIEKSPLACKTKEGYSRDGDANSSVSQSEGIKLCTRLNDDCSSRKGYTCQSVGAPCEESGRPWICRGCDKIPASCGKDIEDCEKALYQANEYERGGHV